MEEIKQKQLAADKKTFAHWTVEDGVIHYDGARGIGNIETRERGVAPFCHFPKSLTPHGVGLCCLGLRTYLRTKI